MGDNVSDSSLHPVQQIADMVGGTITDGGILPDGSGFAILSMPLPRTHWIFGNGESAVPPMPFRLGVKEQCVFAPYRPGLVSPVITREDVAERIRDAGRYAVRSATMNGKEMDFDPDALIQNLVVGMLGYHTENGLTDDDWANPTHGGGSGWVAPFPPQQCGEGAENSALQPTEPAPHADSAAVLAERERCARITETHTLIAGMPLQESHEMEARLRKYGDSICADIARDIRHGSFAEAYNGKGPLFEKGGAVTVSTDAFKEGIAVERLRCARIAEGFFDGTYDCGESKPCCSCSGGIAERIRGGE